MQMNIDTFGEIMDDFLKKNPIQMIITMQEGTPEPTVEDNTGSMDPVIQLYILLETMVKVLEDLFKLMEVEPEGKKRLVKGILELVYDDLIMGKEGEET